MTGIIEQVRSEAYDAGMQEGITRGKQERMMRADELYYQGQVNARKEAPSRAIWFIWGMIATLVTTNLLWWLG